MSRVLIIDDDKAFLNFLKGYVKERFPSLELDVCIDPVKGLASISPDLDLMLFDLEMPGIDGCKLLAYAIEKGINKNRIIILSGRDADYLHERFPMGSCLAVLNKHELRQKNVLDMVFKSLEDKQKKRLGKS